MPYCFFWSSIKFQGHTGWKINDLNPIWVRLLGRSQLSNPSDLPCLHQLKSKWCKTATVVLSDHVVHSGYQFFWNIIYVNQKLYCWYHYKTAVGQMWLSWASFGRCLPASILSLCAANCEGGHQEWTLLIVCLIFSHGLAWWMLGLVLQTKFTPFLQGKRGKEKKDGNPPRNLQLLQNLHGVPFSLLCHLEGHSHKSKGRSHRIKEHSHTTKGRNHQEVTIFI